MEQASTAQGPLAPSLAAGAPRPASFGARWGAAVIDWSVCLFASYTIVPVVCVLLFRGTPYLVVAYAAPAAYFVVLPVAGGTLGMRALSLRMARAGGRMPLASRTLLRGILTIPSGFACVTLALIGFAALSGHLPSGAGAELSATRTLILAAVASPWLVSSLWMFMDPGRQPLHDRLLGVRLWDTSPVWIHPARPGPPRPAAAPSRPLRPFPRAWRWGAVAAAVSLALVASAFLLAAADLVAEDDPGAAGFGLAITGGAAFAGWWLGRRAFGKPWRFRLRSVTGDSTERPGVHSS